MRWRQIVLGWLDFLSDGIRETEYKDEPFDKQRHSACCAGVGLFLIGATAYCTFIVLTRPEVLVSLPSPSWQTVQQHSAEGYPVQCECKQTALPLEDILEPTECPDSDWGASDTWQEAIATLAIVHSFLYEMFWDHVAYRVPMKSWNRWFLLYKDHPDQSSWDVERANVALGKRLGSALMQCVDNSATETWEDYRRWAEACNCTEGLCASYRRHAALTTRHCAHALDALPDDVRAFAVEKQRQHELISAMWLENFRVPGFTKDHPDLSEFYRWMTLLLSMPRRVASRLFRMPLEFGSYQSDNNYSSHFVTAIEHVERDYHRLLKREGRVVGPLLVAMGNASGSAIDALKGFLGTMHHMELLGLTKPIVDHLVYEEVLPGLVVATAAVGGSTDAVGPVVDHGWWSTECLPQREYQGDLKIALRGGGDMDARRRRGRGGVGQMGFRVGPFVLCENRCWRQRRRNTKFGPKKFFPPIIPPPPFE